MEALPRALRLHHDVVGEAGLSPYHIMFGRNRPTQGIIYTPNRSCENSHQFFQRMEQIDKKIAEEINKIHLANATRRNLHKPQRENFQMGDLVWQLKPQSMGSENKILPRWNGPLQIKSKVGSNTYLAQDKLGHSITVHIDQLKPYVAIGDSEELAGLIGYDSEPDQILGCRETVDGEMEYLLTWRDSSLSPHWVSHSLLQSLGLTEKVDQYHSSLE